LSLSESGWCLSHPLPNDDRAVLELMRAYDLFVSGEPDTDLDDIHHDWSSIDLERDAWLVYSNHDGLSAYAAITTQQTTGLRIQIYTAPGLIESELPGQLLDIVLNRAEEIVLEVGAGLIEHLVAYITHSNSHFRNLFERVGFIIARYIYQMRKEMPSPPDEPQWPHGIHVRTFVPGTDDLATYELVQQAFERPGHPRYSFETWKRHMLRPGSYKPELWTLAFSGEDLVGVCLAFDYPDEGWVRQLGVSDAWRGQGLGSALLKNAFATFYKHGKHRVGLTTESDNPVALAFYEHVGMSIRRQYDEYVKDIA
jgi:mycothiol synthase